MHPLACKTFDPLKALHASPIGCRAPGQSYTFNTLLCHVNSAFAQDKITGKAKEGFGSVTGDQSKKSEGRLTSPRQR